MSAGGRGRRDASGGVLERQGGPDVHRQRLPVIRRHRPVVAPGIDDVRGHIPLAEHGIAGHRLSRRGQDAEPFQGGLVPVRRGIDADLGEHRPRGGRRRPPGGRRARRRRGSRGTSCRRGTGVRRRPGRGGRRSGGRGRSRRRRRRGRPGCGRRWTGTASCRGWRRGASRTGVRSGRCRPGWCGPRAWPGRPSPGRRTADAAGRAGRERRPVRRTGWERPCGAPSEAQTRYHLPPGPPRRITEWPCASRSDPARVALTGRRGRW